jgi:hypothetical protein
MRLVVDTFSSLVVPYKNGGTRRSLVLLMNTGRFERTAKTLVGLRDGDINTASIKIRAAAKLAGALLFCFRL